MAQNKTAKLMVQLSDEDRRKLILPDGIPETMEELLVNVRDTCGIRGNFRLQYQDKEFGVFLTLTNTGDLENLGIIKVISLPDEGAAPTTELAQCHNERLSTCSTETDDTILLSSPDSVSSRTEQWPRVFPIPVFSYDTELQLERGNAAYLADGTRFIVTTKMKQDILQKICDTVYKYKSYTVKEDLAEVAQALVNKHPCLKEPGSFNGAYGWRVRISDKVNNFRTLLKGLGCPEFAVNSMKNKAPGDAYPAKNIKRPKRGEANHMPSFPVGETAEQLEMERQALLKEVKKRNNDRIIRGKMAKTFALRRQEIVDKQPRVEVLQERWPALFGEEEVGAEFQRITTVPLQARFMASLDKQSGDLLQIIRSKGGAIREKTKDTLQVMDQSMEINVRRECLLKCLIMYLGEDVSCLIKEFLVVQKDEAETELANTTMGVFVLRENQGPLSEPVEIGIIIDGVEVLSGLSSVASACAMLFGLIYALDLKYPEGLKFSFEAFQKIIMDIERKKMSKRVQNLAAKLQDLV